MPDKKVAHIQERRMGPRTAEGRSRALAARLRGKLPHSVLIVPGIESAEEWEGFRLAIVGEYEPVGTLELELASRIAELLWRLRRFSRYETDCAAWRMKMAQVGYHRLRDELRATVAANAVPYILAKPDDSPGLIRARTAMMQSLWYLDNDADLDGEHGESAVEFIQAAAEAVGLRKYRVRSREKWTILEVRRHIGRIAVQVDKTPEAVLNALFGAAARDVLARQEKGSAEERFYTSTLNEYRRTLVLPTESEIRNAARWESHLERAVCRMMDRLERLQRMRAGEVLPAPAIVRIESDED